MKKALIHAHHTLWITFIFFLMLAAFIISAARLMSPWLSEQKPFIEKWASTLLKRPLTIEKLTIDWEGVTPVLRCYNVTIFNLRQTRPLLSANELDIGVSLLRSVLSAHVYLESLRINGLRLTVRENQDGKISIRGLGSSLTRANTDDGGDTLNDLMLWLLSVPAIALHDVDLTWYDKNNNVLPVTGLNFNIKNQGDEHIIWGQAQLAQAVASALNFTVKMDGDWQQSEKITATLYVKAQNIVLEQWLNRFNIHNVTGLASFSLWGRWRKQQWQNWQSLLTLDNATIFNNLNSAALRPTKSQSGRVLYKNQAPLVNLKHFTGNFYFEPQPSGGHLQLASDDAQLDFGKAFRAPIALNNLFADVSWQPDKQGWNINAKSVTLNNQDFAIDAQFNLSLPGDGSSPYLSLLSGYRLFSAQHLSNYLPLTALSPDLVKWLTNAIVRFADVQGTLVIHGALQNFPFSGDEGTFIVDSQINDADLAYWPEWPALKHFSGELLFNGPKMQVFAQAGQLFNAHIQQLQAEIPTLKKGVHSFLQIQAGLNGDLTDAWRFLKESPLHKTLKSAVDNLQPQGPLQLQLGLMIPLQKNQPIKVNGQADTQNASIKLPQWNLQLANLQGQLSFTENTLNAQNLTATLWQKPIAIQIMTLPPQQNMQIQLTGQVAMQDLQRQWQASLLKAIEGDGYFTVLLRVANKNQADTLSIMSDLKGIAVNLPAPLAKEAAETRAFNLTTNLSGGQAFNRLQINYGNLAARLNKGAIQWQVNIQSPQAQGSILLPFNSNLPIQADLQKLYLADVDNNDQKQRTLKPEDVPNLYINCRDFRYGDKNFGALTIQLKPLADGVAISYLQAVSPFFKLTADGSWRTGKSGADWTVLNGSLTSANIAGALASWNIPQAGFTSKNTTANFALRWPGAPYAFDFAKLNGNLALELKDGQINDVGADSSVKMNLGRILTLTSWQSITRRLNLNFSDLTKQGYSFNILKGDFKLREGDAFTRNTYLDGPMAKVTVNGRIGLAAEDFDLKLGVTTHLSTSISLLAGIAGGPVVGIATGAASWLADKVLGKQMDKIVTDDYRLTGPWQKPQVAKWENANANKNN